jgi:hypothetical protein
LLKSNSEGPKYSFGPNSRINNKSSDDEESDYDEDDD